MSKKYMLFIVEGITDVSSLGLLLHEYFSNEKIEFQITNGDITTKYGNKPSNIMNKIGDEIRTFMSKKRITKAHISEIVHIVDTDGAFIDDTSIIHDPTVNISYESNCIKTNSTIKIIERNNQKRGNISLLYPKTKIMGTIPYSMYYFSCNLEDFFHDVKNAKDEEKNELAYDLEDRYDGKVDEFIEFICQSSLSPNEDYISSWIYIKKDHNSLSRCSNFNILVKR